MQSNGEKIVFKSSVKKACIELLQQRIHNAMQAMAMAQENANEQEKSSVGDKHETARAMSQADRDMNARQLAAAQKSLGFLENIQVNTIYHTIVPGALFSLGNQLFFVAEGLGSLSAGNKTVMVISKQSPLFEKIKLKQKGDKVIFQDKPQEITDVY